MRADETDWHEEVPLHKDEIEPEISDGTWRERLSTVRKLMCFPDGEGLLTKAGHNTPAKFRLALKYESSPGF